MVVGTSAAVVLILALAACSGIGSPTGIAGDISPSPAESPVVVGSTAEGYDACQLLSGPELVSIGGGKAPVAKAVPGNGGLAGQCAYSSPDAAFLISIGTAASLKAAGDPIVPDAKAKLDDFWNRMTAGGAVRELPGVGERAIVGKTAAAAYKAGTYVEVLGIHVTDEQLVAIIKQAMANL